MAITAEQKQQLLKEFGISEGDTGSPQTQIAVLTAEIRAITDHLKTHPKDYSSRRGLLGMVSRRRKFLDYLKRKAPTQYVEMLSRLQIRK